MKRTVRVLATLLFLAGPLALALDPSATTTPSMTSISANVAAARPEPALAGDHSVSYVAQPIKPPAQVLFNVTVDPHVVKAGTTADIVVTLKLNDRPQNGAAIKLAMLFTPGNDYTFTPDNGVTDASGVFRAIVTVSKNAGDSVIAATSGVLADQDHVTGTASVINGKVAVAPPTNHPAPSVGFMALVLLGVAVAGSAGLVVAGLYLKMRSRRA